MKKQREGKKKKKALIWHLDKILQQILSYNLDGHCIFDVKYLDISLKHFSLIAMTFVRIGILYHSL